MAKIFLCMAAALGLVALQAAELHLGQTLEQWQAQLDGAERLERLRAARSIGEMALADHPGAADALWRAIGHEDSGVRYWAVVAAGQLGERARPAGGRLVRALDDEAPEVRIWAGFALARSGDAERGIEAIVRELANPEKGVRLQAVHAADELGTAARTAIPALQAAVKDDFDYVARVARHALWVMNERDCPYRDCD
jgi:HEAT repeat protein